MRLYLVRHAIAVDREAPGIVSDAARELTAEGMQKMRRNAAALRQLGVKLSEIWTSPLLRARQTAEILSEGLGEQTPVHIVKPLEPNGHFEELLARLDENSTLDAVALVGHEPFLGEFSSFLIGGPRNLSIPFKKGGVACIEIEEFRPPLSGQLCWLLTPKQMGQMV
jgi:phosphohistidine phosphatase